MTLRIRAHDAVHRFWRMKNGVYPGSVWDHEGQVDADSRAGVMREV